MKRLTEMAREAGFKEHNGMIYVATINDDCAKELKAFAALVRADERNSWPAEMEAMERQVNLLTDALAQERKQIANLCEEFARKWWKIHCDSNLHYSSTLKAHQDFCALQAAIRARSNT
jgi:hypothetical protein